MSGMMKADIGFAAASKENWKFDVDGLMPRRIASTKSSTGPWSAPPMTHSSLSDLGL
jgi:nuclear transport factor 2 (NTF2) superfamily protein